MATTSHLPCEQLRAGPDAQTGAASFSLLTRLCARDAAPDRGASRIRALAQSGPDWSALLDAAGDHSVVPLLCKRVLEPAGDALPAVWRDRFRQEFAANVHRNLLLTAELIRVLRALEGCGLQAIPFKGPALAQQAYGDLALRQFTDLDVVLPHSQIAEAHRALERLGYHSESAVAAMTAGRIPGQYAYRCDAHQTLLELHTEQTMRYLPAPLDWTALGSRLETVPVGGQPLHTFSVEDTMMMLCVHGAKHFWTRLGWICDIAELVQAPRGIDWPRAEKLARRMRCYRMWLLGLALAHEMLAAPLPEAVVRQIRRNPRVLALAGRVQNQFLLSGESSISAGERVRFRSDSQDTLATSLRQLTVFATRPTDEDWQSHVLPRWAAPLYAILRPLRILRRYGWSR